MIDLNKIVSAVNEAPSGSFIGITDYISEKGDVSSITGQIGVSYGTAKEKAIAALEKAIADKDFEAIEVKGVCRWDDEAKEWNSRKRSCPMKPFAVKYSKAEVLDTAIEVLESYREAVKKSNKVELSNKEDGCYLESETNNINIRLLVQNQTYKELESQAAKANKGITEKPKASMPLSLLKAQIRKRFEPKIKSFTIRSDNFVKLTIGGQTFE
jgi:hypothetical protein